MGKEGPCCHCGIDYTPLWRNGPPEKPVLCNACGSRWRTRGTLTDYIPKHAMKDIQGELPPIGTTAAESEQSSAFFGGIRNSKSSSSSESTENGPSEPRMVLPRRRRSVLNQIVLTPTERLNKQLFDLVYEYPDIFLKKPADEDVLLYPTNGMMLSTPSETALGAMLLGLPSESEPTESALPSSGLTEDKHQSP